MYQDQSASQLRLCVVGGRLDLGQFTVLEEESVAFQHLEVRAAIIGASHVFGLGVAGDPALHEIFACAQPCSRPATLLSAGVDEIPAALECSVPVDTGRIGYRFRPWRTSESRGAAALARLESRIAAARRADRPDRIGLAHTFPTAGPAGAWRAEQGRGAAPSGSAQPRTLVLVEVTDREQRVLVETAHCYPNESTIVFSRTRVELPDASGGGA